MSNLAVPWCASWVSIDYTWGPPLYDSEAIIQGGIRLQLMFGLLCCYYCALTWTVFDHVLTFHDEVIYVWVSGMMFLVKLVKYRVFAGSHRS